MLIIRHVAKTVTFAALVVIFAAAGALAVAASAQDGLPSLERGEQLYRENCSTCHDVNGRGDGPAAQGIGFVPADLVAKAESLGDGELYRRISEGHGPMPPRKFYLNDQQLADVVRYLRHGLYRGMAKAIE